MTPMIDVVFQMLIFFMIGMEIKEPEGRLDSFLPKDKGQAAANPEDELEPPPPEVKIILIRSETTDQVEIYFEQYQCESINDLAGKLLKLKSAGMSGIPVVIDGGPKVPFGFILGALNACVKSRFTQISFKAPPAS